MGKIKVLIVDDSAFMRKLISDFLSENPAIQVVGTARNGEIARKKIKELQPDVVTLDVEMPVLNGLEALKIIMQENPLPVVMLSSDTKEGTDTTFKAMEAGAIDFVAKPSGTISLDLHKVKDELINKVLSASKANIKQLLKFSAVKENIRSDQAQYSKIEPSIKSDHTNQWHQCDKKIVCIGTSTGGPRALQQVLINIPKNIDAPILIVQHMPEGFTKSLAERLNSICKIRVKEAEEGEIIRSGTAYIAPGGSHLKLKHGTPVILADQEEPPRNGHRPSVDVMFESVSMLENYAKIAVIMTGMGNDGAKGLAVLKKTGAVKAIAESQQSSIVFGMPKAAIETNLIDEVEDVENIAQAILKFV
ncbi:chemotaxis response regulator protein-glutamate methylesterase [Bacillaceae bacterium Marseille-Q3522]|nr:chemotaxis response regulator protein-glutamate methylesterase [Bacillaceae bacterium Marseille-Q3522]